MVSFQTNLAESSEEGYGPKKGCFSDAAAADDDDEQIK
jgi:hypothetical protein